MAKKTSDIITEYGYDRLLEEEGLDALEAAVRTNHGEATADRVLKAMKSGNVDNGKENKMVEKKNSTSTKTKPENGLNKCGCGCGQMVKNRFAMGHDARLKGQLLRIVYWTKPTAEIPKKPTDAQVGKAVERMHDEGWGYMLDMKRMEQTKRMRDGKIAGTTADKKVRTDSSKITDSVLKVNNARKPGARVFDADDEGIEEID